MDEQYFNDVLIENEEWWARIDESIDFLGRRVLDLGCGRGALSVDIALKGASEVVGVDVDSGEIAFATRMLHERYPALVNKVHFHCTDIRASKECDYYDYVLCKDSFEHIDDLPGVTSSVLSLLKKPGGKLIVGFSPLYYSPLGDHGRLRLPPIVWLHAILPEPLALRIASFKHGYTIGSISDIGLNKLTPKEFLSLFPATAWKVDIIRYNCRCRYASIFNAGRRLWWLEKYFTVSIYGILEVKTAVQTGPSQ